VDAVEADDVTRVVERLLAPPDRTLAVVGPVDQSQLSDRMS